MTTERRRPDLLRAALDEAVRVRGCPPAELLGSRRPDEQLEGHLRSCLFCREERELLEVLEPTRQGWESHGGRPTDAGPVRPGDVRLLGADLAGWGPRARYHKPPLVLVMEALPAMERAVRVCLVHDFPDLAGPGDVELAPGLFAESWNHFTAPTGRLGPAVRRVEDAVLERVLRAFRAGMGTEPPAAHLGREDAALLEHYLTAFRRLEVETAAFFSLRLMEEVLAEGESKTGDVHWKIPQDPKEFRKRFGPYIQVREGAEPSPETLITAPWTDALLPRAAAEGATLFARLYRPAASEKILEPVAAKITFWQHRPDGLVVGGQIRAALGENARLEARLVRAGRVQDPQEAHLDPASGYFRLLFPVPDVSQADPGPQDVHLLVILP